MQLTAAYTEVVLKGVRIHFNPLKSTPVKVWPRQVESYQHIHRLSDCEQ